MIQSALRSRLRPLLMHLSIGRRLWWRSQGRRDEQLTRPQHANVLTSIAFLTGLSAEELSAEELSHVDPFFPTLISVTARAATE